MNPLLVEGMFGLGDNIFQRAVLREVVKTRTTYLITPWPQIYRDLPVRCVKPRTTLRTQAKNADRPWRWHEVPGLVDHQRLSYAGKGGTIMEALCAELRVKTDVLDFSGPPVNKPDREPYIIVRPSTVRKEWIAASRNPHPGYINRAVQALRGRYRIVSVADIHPPEEVASEELPYADERYDAGELDIEQLLALTAGATAIVGGVGWAITVALAYRVPMFLIFGGWLADNGPARIFDRRLDLSRVYQVMPDRPCMCSRNNHACDKTIAGLDDHIERFMLRLERGEFRDLAAAMLHPFSPEARA